MQFDLRNVNLQIRDRFFRDWAVICPDILKHTKAMETTFQFINKLTTQVSFYSRILSPGFYCNGKMTQVKAQNSQKILNPNSNIEAV